MRTWWPDQAGPAPHAHLSSLERMRTYYPDARYPRMGLGLPEHLYAPSSPPSPASFPGCSVLHLRKYPPRRACRHVHRTPAPRSTYLYCTSKNTTTRSVPAHGTHSRAMQRKRRPVVDIRNKVSAMRAASGAPRPPRSKKNQRAAVLIYSTCGQMVAVA